MHDFAIEPLGIEAAVSAAIATEARDRRNRLIDDRHITVHVPPERAFAAIRRIGGANGWYYGNWLWQIRGGLDILVGGVGMRRGRRDPDQLAVNDHVDWWNVETCEPTRLVLAAEMNLPGRAWLEFQVTPPAEGSTIRQTAVFDHLGNRIEYTLDNAGNRIAEQVKDPGGVLSRQLSRSIDALRRVQQTTGRE